MNNKNLFIPVLFVITLILQLFFPWWIIAATAFVVCFFYMPGQTMAFLGAFLAIFFLWTGKAVISDSNFDQSMANLIGGLLGKMPGFATYIITGLIGGLIAGLFGLLGNWSRVLVKI